MELKIPSLRVFSLRLMYVCTTRKRFKLVN